jgi:hypothetical protein
MLVKFKNFFYFINIFIVKYINKIIIFVKIIIFLLLNYYIFIVKLLIKNISKNK